MLRAGNAHNDTERALAVGYDNGDIKLFDLRTTSSLWETNMNSGVRVLTGGGGGAEALRRA